MRFFSQGYLFVRLRQPFLLSAGQVAQPAVLVKMMDDPGNFTNLVQTGAGIHQKNRPVEEEGTAQSSRNSDHPHDYEEGENVKFCVSACIKNTVDDDGVNAAPDHIKRGNDKHSGAESSGIWRKPVEEQNRMDEQENDTGRHETNQEGDLHQFVTVDFCAIEMTLSELTSEEDGSGIRNAVTHTAGKVAHNGSYGISCGSILAQMPHDGGIGGESDSPKQRSAEQRQTDLPEIVAQKTVPLEESRKVRADKPLLKRGA